MLRQVLDAQRLIEIGVFGRRLTCPEVPAARLAMLGDAQAVERKATEGLKRDADARAGAGGENAADCSRQRAS